MNAKKKISRRIEFRFNGAKDTLIRAVNRQAPGCEDDSVISNYYINGTLPLKSKI